jgi:guanosine-3',5'-bis(diphosphate) 3'-pyrophosphohydrolase
MPNSTGQVRHQLMLRIDELKPADRALAAKALSVAEEAHKGQFRKPHRVDSYVREPYVIHPMRVALIICDELKRPNIEELCAGLLHDTVEDSEGKVTTADLETQFGRSIALMVSVLTKPPADKKIEREKQLQTYHDRIAQAALPTRLVKLSDRLDNIRECILANDVPFQKRYLIETREVYVPLAQDSSHYMFEQIRACCNELEKLLSSEQ